MSAHQTLRTATAADHARIDAAFAGFDLTRRADYVAFLKAHARALPAIEAALAAGGAGADGMPSLRARTPLLAADLAALGEAMPAAPALPSPAGPAEAFGMRYVIEGSRLGGGMLARGVGEGLPRAYLSDVHRSGEWRGFTQALDAAADGERWIAAAAAAAGRTFDLYGQAARAGQAA